MVPMKLKPQNRLSLRRPTCTHIVMNRAYGTDYRCHVCDHYPSLGWIYVCQQDVLYPVENSDYSKAVKGLSASELPPDASSLELLGCNRSVVDAAKAGHYTEEQIKTIISQKLHVRDVIAAQLQQSNLPISPNLASESPKTKQAKLRKENPAMKEPTTSPFEPEVSPVAPVPTCDFKCCFNCRPLSRDRAVSSFESVMSEPHELSEPWDPHHQPVAIASIVSNINPWRPASESLIANHGSITSSVDDDSGFDFGPVLENTSYVDMLRQAYSRHSLDTYHTQEEVASRGFRSSWKRALEDMVRARQGASRGMDPARGSERNGLAVYYKEDEKEEGVQESASDLQLFKRLSDEIQREASTVSLPTPDGDSFPEKSDQHETLQSEKHVNGGVAVTEEAIENQAPDIITAV